MDSQGLEVLQLHRHPEFLKECCELINDEWPRSETARMMSLQASCDNLPTSLILVQDRISVLGHCKLTPIPNIRESCFIETVVISKSMRGKKLGTFLMQRVEDYCKTVLYLKMLHLSTKGQENFYAKLGYVICAPITIFGGCPPLNNSHTTASHKSENPVPHKNSFDANGPPPPPPLPPVPKKEHVASNLKTNKTYMFKYL